MQILSHSLLAAFAIPFFLPACAGIPGESPEQIRGRMERQDNLVDRHQEKRKIRAEAADRRPPTAATTSGGMTPGASQTKLKPGRRITEPCPARRN